MSNWMIIPIVVSGIITSFYLMRYKNKIDGYRWGWDDIWFSFRCSLFSWIWVIVILTVIIQDKLKQSKIKPPKWL